MNRKMKLITFNLIFPILLISMWQNCSKQNLSSNDLTAALTADVHSNLDGKSVVRQSKPVFVEVFTSTSQQLPSNLSGYNTRYDQIAAHWADTDFVNLTKKTQPRVLRWPSGTMSDFSDWRTGLNNSSSPRFGGWSLLEIFAKVYPADYCRIKPETISTIMSAKGGNRLFDQKGESFFEFAKKVGANKILVVVNTFTDSPLSAYSLAKFAAEKKIPVAAFSLGNEPSDVHPSKTSDIDPTFLPCPLPRFPNTPLPAWLQNIDIKESKYDQAIQYLTRMKWYAENIRRGYLEGGGAESNLKIALAAGFIGDWMPASDWNRAMNDFVKGKDGKVDQSKIYWNTVDLHHYPNGVDPENDLKTDEERKIYFGRLKASVNYSLKMDLSVHLPKIMNQSWAIGKDLIISEYNATLSRTQMNGSFYSGIYAAEYLMRASKVPKLKHIAMHMLTGGGGIRSPFNKSLRNPATGIFVDNWKTLLAEIGLSGEEYDYDRYPAENLYLTAQQEAISLANSVINSSEKIYATKLTGDLPTVPALRGELNWESMDALYAQAYGDFSGGKVKILISNKGSSKRELQLKVNSKQVKIFTVKELSNSDPSIIYSDYNNTWNDPILTEVTDGKFTVPGFGIVAVTYN